MEVLKIEATDFTPEVNFDPDAGKFEIKGRSLPENSVEFYRPIMEWMDQLIANPVPEFTIDLHYEFFNTSSSRLIFDMLKKLDGLNESGNCKVYVNWHYWEYDEDIQEEGEDFDALLKLNIDMVEEQE